MQYSDFSSALQVLSRHLEVVGETQQINFINILPASMLPRYHSIGIGYVEIGAVYRLSHGVIISRTTLQELRDRNPHLGLASSEGTIGSLVATGSEDAMIFAYRKGNRGVHGETIDLTVFMTQEANRFDACPEIKEWLNAPILAPD